MITRPPVLAEEGIRFYLLGTKRTSTMLRDGHDVANYHVIVHLSPVIGTSAWGRYMSGSCNIHMPLYAVTWY